MSREPARHRAHGIRNRRILRGLQAIAGLTVLAGALMAFQESQPFTMHLKPQAERQAAFLETTPGTAGLLDFQSRFARWARIETCTDDWSALESDPAQRGSDTAKRLLAACLDIARLNLTMAPASSNDWMIAATLSNLRGDLPATAAYLERSLATGPTEQWIAKRRAVMLFELQDSLDDSLRGQIDAQLGLLLRTEEGIKSVAEIYLRNRAFRERIIQVAETVEPVYQRRFLHFVKTWAQDLQSPPPPAVPAG